MIKKKELAAIKKIPKRLGGSQYLNQCVMRRIMAPKDVHVLIPMIMLWYMAKGTLQM